MRPLTRLALGYFLSNHRTNRPARAVQTGKGNTNMKNDSNTPGFEPTETERQIAALLTGTGERSLAECVRALALCAGALAEQDDWHDFARDAYREATEALLECAEAVSITDEYGPMPKSDDSGPGDSGPVTDALFTICGYATCHMEDMWESGKRTADERDNFNELVAPFNHAASVLEEAGLIRPDTLGRWEEEADDEDDR